MKVIILAGGFGTRLGTITDYIPKPMVLIGNRPIIWHIMKAYSYYGFNDFVISLGYKANVIKDFFMNYTSHTCDFKIDLSTKEIELISNHAEENWKVTLVDTGLNTLKGARIKRIEKYLNDHINMITYGDGLANINIKDVLNYHLSHKKILTLTGVYPPSRFGDIIENKGKVISFIEKPQTSQGLINGGFMVFNKELLDYLTIDENCDLEHNIFEKLAKMGEIMVYKHEGQWECIDNERDLNHLNKLWNNNNAFWKVWK